jgi:prepilin signal peptidase PulO-like enzyme (type II secretory pathway)
MIIDITCNLLGAAFLLPLGLVLGSFLELVADRLPRGESILWPPSHCRICSHRLTPGELVPVLSFLVQRGRCASCDTPIDPGIPVREGLSGAALALPWAVMGCGRPAFALGLSTVLLLGGWAVWFVVGSRQPQS